MGIAVGNGCTGTEIGVCGGERDKYDAEYLIRTGLVRALPHLHRDWAHPCHICTWTGLTPATSAPGVGSPLPHLHRDWPASSARSCAGAE